MSPSELFSIYRDVFIKEFIREFQFLADVAAGHVTAKGDFTDKLSKLFTSALSNTLGHSNVPGLDIVGNLVELSVDWLNDW